jgi:L-rhamnose isomerase/sugar isomerase
MEPILAMSRLEKGGAIDLLGTYRASKYREKVAEIRPVVEAGSSGIV